MLFFMVSSSLVSLRKDQRELAGIETLRPAILLMQIVPQYTRFSFDHDSGYAERIKQTTENLLVELTEKYEKSFGREVIDVSLHDLTHDWSIVSGDSPQYLALSAYKRLMDNLHGLIVYIGDISGLVTDSELESSYLVTAAVQELSQMQERIVAINNIFRVPANGELFEKQKIELEQYYRLLVYSNNIRVQNNLKGSEIARLRKGETEVSQIFENLLNLYLIDVNYFTDTIESVINSQLIELLTINTLNEIIVRMNNNIYQLQNASLARLETLISGRIQTNQRHLVQSLALSVIAVVLAFAIAFVTVVNIRRSTRAINSLFRNLENNDLSAGIEAFSGDELGELAVALDSFLEKLKTAFASFNQNASLVSTAVYDLSASAKEITTTANEQSASVAEIVSTMENTKNLSEQVAVKTVEVVELASQTQDLSRRGADLRDANEDMMLDIRNQNIKISEEIRNLADMLSRIDESVQLIDTIADHTKLIAFNAALEASSSGEAGVRFAVVASEIRRFADNVVESVVEIKEKISELQSESQALITEADSGSMAIEDGYKRMVEQKKVFENIVNASQNVATRSQQISNLSKQQELAAAQIFTALKEISLGVKQFVTATASTSATADNLNNMSAELKETLAKYKTTK
jgi:methyl-accepting chemotaxis protein